MDKAAAYRELFRHRQNLTKQQFRTFSGQINSGDAEGAVRGLEKLTEKENGNAKKGTNPPRAGQ